MAGLLNAITLGQGRKAGADGVSWAVYFLFDIPVNVRIEQRDSAGLVTGTDWVPTPATEIPADIVFTAGEIADLNAGTKLLVALRVTQHKDTDDPAFLVQLRSKYSSLKPDLQETYETLYLHHGKKFEELA